jgi:hypothetical protein
MTDTSREIRGFPPIEPIDAPPEMARFMTAARRAPGAAGCWKVTPIDEPLVSRGRIDRIDGRKAFLTATMTDAGGTVLSEASGLMIKLLPHQP